MKLQFEKILLSKPEPEQYYGRINKHTDKNGTQMTLHLGSQFVDITELDGRIVEFLSMPAKKVLGFRVLENVKLENMSKLTMRQFKKDKTNNQVSVGIGRFLQSMDCADAGGKGIKFEIHKGDDQMYGEVYYIELNKPIIKHENN